MSNTKTCVPISNTNVSQSPPLSGDMGHRDELKGRNWSGLSGTWVRSKGMTKGIRSIEYLGCGKEGTCWYVGEGYG